MAKRKWKRKAKKKWTKKRARKGGFKKARKTKVARPSIIKNKRQRTWIADRFMTTLVYRVQDFTSSAGAIYAKFFSLNGVYDPETLLGNPGCVGFREVASIWQNYQCFGSRMKMVVYPTSYAGGYYITVIPRLGTGSQTIPAFLPAVRMQDSFLSKTWYIPGAGAGRPVVIKYFCPIKALYLNSGQVKYDSAAMIGSANANPNQTSCWNVYMYSSNGAALNQAGQSSLGTGAQGTNVPIQIQYDIKYYTKWFNRRTVAPPTDAEITDDLGIGGNPIFEPDLEE